MHTCVLFAALLATLGTARADQHSQQPPAASPRTAPPEELLASYWYRDARDAIEARRARLHSSASTHARNVVLFMGDGMSMPTLAAARTLFGQRSGRPGEETQLSFEAFPTVGLAKTYCVNTQTADSACSATALLCGAKANAFTLGLTAAVPRLDCAASLAPAARLESVAAWALAAGRDAGVVTTTRITHASPAGAYARAAERNWESDAAVRAAGHDVSVCPDIAHQLVHLTPGNQLKVILGGGRRMFLNNTTVDEEGTPGERTDGRNLIEEWQTDKVRRNVTYQYAWNRDQLLRANATLPDYLLGLFEGDHLGFHLESDRATEPTLAELTEVAIRILSRNEKGFFLFVESGRIDHAHHDNQAQLALDETIELSTAVSRAVELLDERDSLVVVTADHTHVMAFNGYNARGADVLGPVGMRDSDGVPYMTLSYTNGPGRRLDVDRRRPDVTLEPGFRSPRWPAHVDVPLPSETHGSDDVPVFAWGAHNEMFTGLYEQSHVPHRIAYASCFGGGPQACDSAAAPSALALPLAAALFVLLRALA